MKSLKDLAFSKSIVSETNRKALCDYSHNVKLTEQQLVDALEQEVIKENWDLALSYLKRLNDHLPKNSNFILVCAYDDDVWKKEHFKSFVKTFAYYASHPSDLCYLAYIFSSWMLRDRFYYKYLKMIASRINPSIMARFLELELEDDFRADLTEDMILAMERAPELFNSSINNFELMITIIFLLKKELCLLDFKTLFTPLFSYMGINTLNSILHDVLVDIMELGDNNNPNLSFIAYSMLRWGAHFQPHDLEWIVDNRNIEIISYINKIPEEAQVLSEYISAQRIYHMNQVQYLDSLAFAGK